MNDLLQQEAKASKSLYINENDQVWDELYRKLRTLCVRRGLWLSKLGLASPSNQTIAYRKGELRINESFWKSLSPYRRKVLARKNLEIIEVRGLLLKLQNQKHS